MAWRGMAPASAWRVVRHFVVCRAIGATMTRARRRQGSVVARNIVAVDPSLCRVWSLHARTSGDISEHSCRAEIESFARNGQLIAALGRPVSDGTAHQIEIICGARRLFVARHLNVSLFVEVRELTDREALIAMEVENRHRQDISPYERGLAYKRWLKDGLFKSQEDLAQAIQLSASQVCRSLQLARLPAVVVDAFRDPAEIREQWGLAILEALDDPLRRTATIRAARSLCGRSPRLQGREVLRRLLAFCPDGRKAKTQSHDKVVPGSDGSALFRIRYLNSVIALVFSPAKLSEQSLDRIETELAAILQSPDIRSPVARKMPARRTASLQPQFNSRL